MSKNLSNLLPDSLSFNLGPYSFSYSYNHSYFCPEIKRTQVISNQMQEFVNFGKVEDSIKN